MAPGHSDGAVDCGCFFKRFGVTCWRVPLDPLMYFFARKQELARDAANRKATLGDEVVNFAFLDPASCTPTKGGVEHPGRDPEHVPPPSNLADADATLRRRGPL